MALNKTSEPCFIKYIVWCNMLNCLLLSISNKLACVPGMEMADERTLSEMESINFTEAATPGMSKS